MTLKNRGISFVVIAKQKDLKKVQELGIGRSDLLFGGSILPELMACKEVMQEQ